MQRVIAWMLALGLMFSPAALAANDPDAGKPGNEKAKNETKTSPPAPPSNAEIAAEVDQLRALLKAQSDQIAELRAVLAHRDASSAPTTTAAGGTTEVAISSGAPLSVGVTPSSAILASKQGYGDEAKKESPLSFRIGGMDFTPGGFMDFTTIFRSTNTGNLGTNYFAIPFNNAVSAHLTEFRETAQNSRISLKAHGKFGENDITGYYEQDFLGNDAVNAFVTSNSHTERLRLYWLDLKRGKWEILGGQSWSFLTPNRDGLSPAPKDIFYTLNEDFNYQAGLTWTRAAQFRVVYHPSDHWALGLAVENPQQFIGQGQEVIFPSAFNSQLGVQFDAANNSGTPNVMPDFIPKIAYDTNWNGKHLHIEAAGLITGKKITFLPIPQSGSGGFDSSVKFGAGGSVNLNLELLKGLHLIANTFYSDGGGRYIFGMAPDTVVRPLVNSSGVTVAQPSLVHSGSAIGGLEYQVNDKTQFATYYGGVYAQRNFFPDFTNAINPNNIIGFGGPGQAGAQNMNRSIQEGTFDWIQTFWANPNYGRLQLYTQYSYLTRSPWFVAAGAPKNAHLSMGWLSLRYVLP
jgi:hypothetical protein